MIGLYSEEHVTPCEWWFLWEWWSLCEWWTSRKRVQLVVDISYPHECHGEHDHCNEDHQQYGEQYPCVVPRCFILVRVHFI